MDNPSEVFELVDENDTVIGTELRGIVHRKGLLHRAVDCWVFDSQGRLLVQRRSPKKLIQPGRWDLSASEHLQPGETYRQAAARGLEEELGIQINPEALQGPLQPTHKREYHSGDHHDIELVQSYQLDNFSSQVKFDDVEVVEVKWTTLEELQQNVDERPEEFTSWMIQEGLSLGYLKPPR